MLDLTLTLSLWALCLKMKRINYSTCKCQPGLLGIILTISFHRNLAHTRWGLDPRIYTVDFTRSRSAFLYTSIMAASALFMPSAAALSKRLSNHVRTLAHKVVVNRYRSVEI